MKKKLLFGILSILMLCVFAGCGFNPNNSSDDSTSQNSSTSESESTWEDEVIQDQDHGEIELPEVERP